jgi:hypothetical protein
VARKLPWVIKVLGAPSVHEVRSVSGFQHSVHPEHLVDARHLGQRLNDSVVIVSAGVGRTADPGRKRKTVMTGSV